MVGRITLHRIDMPIVKLQILIVFLISFFYFNKSTIALELWKTLVAHQSRRKKIELKNHFNVDSLFNGYLFKYWITIFSVIFFLHFRNSFGQYIWYSVLSHSGMTICYKTSQPLLTYSKSDVVVYCLDSIVFELEHFTRIHSIDDDDDDVYTLCLV